MDKQSLSWTLALLTLATGAFGATTNTTMPAVPRPAPIAPLAIAAHVKALGGPLAAVDVASAEHRQAVAAAVRGIPNFLARAEKAVTPYDESAIAPLRERVLRQDAKKGGALAALLEAGKVRSAAARTPESASRPRYRLFE